MRMRLIILAATLAVACTSTPEPPPAPAFTVESVRVPKDVSTRQISGTVAMKGDGAMTLDSGGANPIPLWMDGSTKVTIDGQPGTGDQLREGDLVRAAYRFDDSGQAIALQITANQKPVPTGRIAQPRPAPASAQPAKPAR